VRTLVDLSLAPEHRRGHGALYDGLNQGMIEIARLRRCVSRATSKGPPFCHKLGTASVVAGCVDRRAGVVGRQCCSGVVVDLLSVVAVISLSLRCSATRQAGLR
jgi:hypothetical protein